MASSQRWKVASRRSRGGRAWWVTSSARKYSTVRPAGSASRASWDSSRLPVPSARSSWPTCGLARIQVTPLFARGIEQSASAIGCSAGEIWPSGPARWSWTMSRSRHRQQVAPLASQASCPQPAQVSVSGTPLQRRQVGSLAVLSPGTMPTCPQSAQTPSRRRAAL
ncbi:hypothetical protein ACFPM0_37340 [Pseudonocardia sulfidoxydans]|uniref:hypothetical protein n=1 Tax=Pseudonocardia sulfidoxydans TaxID=54011 RepID=UPI00361472AC